MCKCNISRMIQLSVQHPAQNHVVNSDLMENIINAGYQLDEETFSKLVDSII